MAIPAIRAATPEVLFREEMLTAYVDLGFGGLKQESCALRIVTHPRDFASVCEAPLVMNVGRLRDALVEICQGARPRGDLGPDLLLVLEAPLSRRFQRKCPVSRPIDLMYGPGLGWHLQPPNAARQAASLILEDLFQLSTAGKLRRVVHLAEGFVSGKKRPRAISKDARSKFAYAAFCEARTLVRTCFSAEAQIDVRDLHLLDTAILQLVHAEKVGQIFESSHPRLQGCESILSRLPDYPLAAPPPVLSVAPEPP